jgi:hypothetical protein
VSLGFEEETCAKPIHQFLKFGGCWAVFHLSRWVPTPKQEKGKRKKKTSREEELNALNSLKYLFSFLL